MERARAADSPGKARDGFIESEVDFISVICGNVCVLSVVENNPIRFGISAKEVESRKQFIRDARLHLADMKTELEAPDVNDRLLSMESTPSVKIK